MMRLILPILFPSWRFFNSIGPSPRNMLQFDAGPWFEYAPKPLQLGLLERLRRLIYNPLGNRVLFVQSCAVRLFDGHDSRAEENIFLILTQAIRLGSLVPPSPQASLRWCVEQLEWDCQGKITASPIYTSQPRSLDQLMAQWQQDSSLCPWP